MKYEKAKRKIEPLIVVEVAVEVAVIADEEPHSILHKYADIIKVRIPNESPSATFLLVSWDE